jgi:hypothetical protein
MLSFVKNKNHLIKVTELRKEYNINSKGYNKRKLFAVNLIPDNFQQMYFGFPKKNFYSLLFSSPQLDVFVLSY